MGLFDGVDLGDDEPKGNINPEYENPDKKSYDDDKYESIDELDKEKKKEEIRKLKISNETALGNLFEKKIVISLMAEISQAIQVSFVHAGRRDSRDMAARLDIPEKSRQLEKLLDEMNEKGINAVINKIESLIEDGVFE